MNKSKKINCAECEYARQDKNASEYSKKYCGRCEKWENCEVCVACKKRDDCKARISQKRGQSCQRRQDTICTMQKLFWKAVECGNPHSEYHKSLLNVTPSGDRQDRVTWSGCREGVAR